MKTPRKLGIARTLSRMGYCSRSQAAVLVRAGRVTINGRRVNDPEFPVRTEHAKVAVDNVPVVAREKVYFVMNKPRGIVTTADDEKGRRTVYDLLSPGGPWVGPVGRLDKASEGILLLTNDSEWAAGITDPASDLDKTYHVQVDRIATDDLLNRLAQDVQMVEEHLRVKSARLLRHGQKHSWLEIRLDEGKNRQIRRLLEALGIRVLRLVRVAIGDLQLGDLNKGAVRPLTALEVRMLSKT